MQEKIEPLTINSTVYQTTSHHLYHFYLFVCLSVCLFSYLLTYLFVCLLMYLFVFCLLLFFSSRLVLVLFFTKQADKTFIFDIVLSKKAVHLISKTMQNAN